MGICEIDAEGRFIRVNPAMCALLGRECGALVGLSVADVTHPDDLEPSSRLIESVLETGEPDAIDKRYLRPDRSVVHANSRAARTNGEDGEPRVLVVTADLTERRRADDAIRTSEEQFRRIVEDAPIPTIMHAEDGEVFQVSRSWTELTGYTIEDADVIQTWLTHAYGFGGDDVRDAMEQAFLPGEAAMRGAVFPITTRAGEERTWSFSASTPGTLRDGRRFVISMAEDVTERMRAEAAQRGSEERQAFLLKLNDALRPIGDAAAIMAVASETLGRHFGVGRCGYGEVDATDEFFIVERDWTNGAMPSFRGRHRLVDFGSEFTEAYRAGRTVLIEDSLADVRAEGAEEAFEAAGGVRSSLGVPLVKNGRFVAGLFVQDAVPRRWSEDDEWLAREVAERTWDAVERARAETAQREGEERFRGFAENSADVLWILEANSGRLEYLSPAFETVWGESREAVMDDIGRWLELVHPDDREDASRSLPRLLDGKVYTATYRIVRPDGEVRWIRDTGFPIHDDGVTRVGGIAQDITGLKSIEARLSAEEERYRLALHVGHLATWDWKLPDGKVSWNDEHFRMQGYAVGEVEPSYAAWAARVHPEDLEQAQAALARARDEHVPYAHEFRNLLPDGSVNWCLASGRFFYAADGTPERMIGVMEDVTQRRLAENALRENEARLQLIYDSLDEYAIFTLDRSGMVTNWNVGAERLLGYSETEAMGMDGRCIFTPEDRANGEADREINTALAEGRAANERWHVRKDESRLWGSGAVLPLHDDNDEGRGNGNGNGEPVLVKIMRDDTGRVRNEEHQKLLLAELQHRVRNILGLVRSLARQSTAGSRSADDFAAHFVGRLDAMARTQVLLTRSAEAGVDLERLVREELVAHVGEGDAIVGGPEVMLPPKSAEVITLALHELATNSVKHGLLGGKDGRLLVRWTLATRDGHDWVDLLWKEDVPVDAAKPARRGFGSDLIEHRVPYELRGTATLDIGPKGVCAEIGFPILDRGSILETGPVREPSQ